MKIIPTITIGFEFKDSKTPIAIYAEVDNDFKYIYDKEKDKLDNSIKEIVDQLYLLITD